MENLLPTTSQRPSASRVSAMLAFRCPLVMAVDAIEHDLRACRLKALIAASMFHLTTWLSRNSVVGVALAVVGRVQRAEPDFRLGDHRFARFLQLAVEPLVDQRQVDHRAGRRQLARAMKYLPSGVALTPCGFFGIGT